MHALKRILAAACLLAAAPVAAGAHDAHEQHTGCRCEANRGAGGWCGPCGAGYIAGVRTTSAALVDVVDPGGHDIDPERMSCADCRAARDAGAFCARHGVGFREGRAYVSKLAYLLAAGEPGSCASACCAGSGAFWCESCGHGAAGPLLFAERADLEAVAPYLARLAEAVDHACPLCAAASFTGGRCPDCRIDYARREGAGQGGGLEK